MKKNIGVIAFVCLFLMLFAFASAEINESKIDKAYECLESKIQGKADTLSVTDISLSILSNPSSKIINECKDALNSKKSDESCWPKGNCNVKETALAVLALDYLGENTKKSEDWLLNQSQVSRDLIWYLEQDSNDAVQCVVSYKGNDYTINIGKNKKIDANAGACLTLTNSDYWLKVASSCYSEEFMVSCNQSFISTFLYKNDESLSSTIFILSDTQSAPAGSSINLKINTKCFRGSSTNCDYESSAWATLALQVTGHDISSFIPYLLASADLNKKYLPNAFIYMITGYEDYGNKLVLEQVSGKYWVADSSVYGKYYDTALALLALSDSSAEQVSKAKDWLFFSQDSNGCWKDSIRDTAMSLWSVDGRKSPRSIGTGNGTSVTDCEDSNYYCVSRSDCHDKDELQNYFCYGHSIDKVCCKSSNLKSCSEIKGEFCKSGESCTGNSIESSDGKNCCVGECKKSSSVISDVAGCEDMGYICKDKCSQNQEKINYECDNGQFCCKTSTSKNEKSNVNWILWGSIIGIILLILIILYAMRDRLKLMHFNKKTGFSSEGKLPSSFSSSPPKPGFPQMRPMPSRTPQGLRRDRNMDATFKKLRDMSK